MKEKFDAKIVLENLRNFDKRLEEIKDKEKKPCLFQYLIKNIAYGKNEIGINPFYLSNFRAKLPAQSPSGLTARATAGSKSSVLPSFVPSYLGSKNRSNGFPGGEGLEPLIPRMGD